MNVVIIQATDTLSGHGTAKGSATERLDGNFSVETSDFDGTLMKQQNRNHISRVSFQITKRTNRNRTQNLLTFEKYY